MFSYRHAFHAGNHADVLKHFVQIQLLQYLNQKDVAYSYIDTHAGAGVYSLDSAQATKNSEFDTGIGPLWERTDLPPALAEYVDLVKAMNPSGKMRYYPGSPYCAEQVAREMDRIRLFELHPADVRLLDENFRKLEAHQAAQGHRPTTRGKRVIVNKADGFLGVRALLPPPSRRALVLCDPPYEDKQDYKKVADMLGDALKRFPSGIYAIWYPVLQRIEARNFGEKLKNLPAASWLNVTLTVSTPGPDGFGLHSSGMFILNPPYTLEPVLKEVMPYLVQVLGRDKGASFTLESGDAATPRKPAARTLEPRKPVGGSLGQPGQPGRRPPIARASVARPASGRPTAPGAASGRGPGNRTPGGKKP